MGKCGGWSCRAQGERGTGPETQAGDSPHEQTQADAIPIRATFHSAVVLSTPELLGSELVAQNPAMHQAPYLRTLGPL